MRVRLAPFITLQIEPEDSFVIEVDHAGHEQPSFGLFFWDVGRHWLVWLRKTYFRIIAQSSS